MLDIQSRIRGGLYGLLVGDALGVPYEFKAPELIPPEDLIEFAPPSGYPRAHPGTPPGTWSDDGAQALALLASLLHAGRLDPEDFGRRLRNWADFGYMAVDHRVFDIGIQTSQAVDALRSGTPALQAGGTAESTLGNGSLMRVLPLVLWHDGPDASLVEDAQNQSRVTHAHPVAQACCALYCLWARRILHASADPWATAVETCKTLYRDNAAMRGALERVLDETARPLRGSGYVIDSLNAARALIALGDYETIVKAAIRLGEDTDTTACIVGGLAGLKLGEAAIPKRWRRGLRQTHTVEELLQSLSSGTASQTPV